MMKKIILSCFIALTMNILKAEDPKVVHDFTVETIEGKKVKLTDYKGQVMLIVNTASKCGLTPQYADLEKLYKQYKDQGLSVLGFPANNFMNQEPGTDDEIMQFCEKNYGVTFDMFSKISVKGKDIHPLYEYLTSKEQNGVVDTKIAWNFQKFLIDKNGKVVATFSPKTSVYDQDVIAALEQELEQ